MADEGIDRDALFPARYNFLSFLFQAYKWLKWELTSFLILCNVCTVVSVILFDVHHYERLASLASTLIKLPLSVSSFALPEFTFYMVTILHSSYILVLSMVQAFSLSEWQLLCYCLLFLCKRGERGLQTPVVDSWQNESTSHKYSLSSFLSF